MCVSAVMYPSPSWIGSPSQVPSPDTASLAEPCSDLAASPCLSLPLSMQRGFAHVGMPRKHEPLWGGWDFPE